MISLDKFTTEDATCISLYVPPRRVTLEVVAQLKQEIGHISNAKEPLKSRVMETLSRIISFIDRNLANPSTGPIGFALFCAPDYPIHFIEPIKPFTINLYRSDNKFHLAYLD